MDERRASPRLRALKAARIILPGGHSTFDCMVRNLSGNGAKLVIETTIAIPDQFDLKFEDGSIRACTVRWRKNKELGITFAIDEPA